MRFSPWRVVLALLDATIVAVAAILATTLHQSGSVSHETWQALAFTLPITIVCLISGNVVFGLYNRVWRFAGIETAVAICLSTTSALLVAALISMTVAPPLPAIVWYTTWMFSIGAIACTRFFWRLVRPSVARVRTNGNGHHHTREARILIYGAGERGAALVRMLNVATTIRYEVVGFLDDNPEKCSAFVGGYKVLGGGADLTRLIDQYDIDEVLIAIPDLPRDQLQSLLARCREARVRAKVMPSMLEVLDRQQAQPRDISIEDLLGREFPVESITLHQNYLAGKTVLVTGAGGSIGSEVSRQVCRYNPKHLILVGRGENRIHWIYMQLCELYPELLITPVVANVTGASSMRHIFETHRPDVVFHTAAHKHVYLMEYVPAEAVRNNVVATFELANIATACEVERFIFISTDKAVAPTSVMGASKRVSELLLTSRPRVGTQCICVRFGNVLGSEGSVLDIFRRQWKNGEPLTITHPDATRYFMSIPEASFLVLQAGAIGDHGDIFVLDMGDPIKIQQLADQFILLNGGNPKDPGLIRVTGLRPGEKLHEALTYMNEDLQPTEDPLIRKVQADAERMSHLDLQRALVALQRVVEDDDNDEALRLLSELTGGTLAQHCTTASQPPDPRKEKQCAS